MNLMYATCACVIYAHGVYFCIETKELALEILRDTYLFEQIFSWVFFLKRYSVGGYKGRKPNRERERQRVGERERKRKAFVLWLLAQERHSEGKKEI